GDAGQVEADRLFGGPGVGRGGRGGLVILPLFVSGKSIGRGAGCGEPQPESHEGAPNLPTVHDLPPAQARAVMYRIGRATKRFCSSAADRAWTGVRAKPSKPSQKSVR